MKSGAKNGSAKQGPSSVPAGLEEREEADAERVKKYEELYKLAMEVYNRELDRDKRKDEMAARYFTVFGLVLAFGMPLSTVVIGRVVPPLDWLQGVSVITGFLFVALMIVVLLQSLAVFQRPPLHEISLTQQLVERFQSDPYMHVLFAMTKTLAQAEEMNKPIIDRKAERLRRAHSRFVAAMVCLIASMLTQMIRGWLRGP